MTSLSPRSNLHRVAAETPRAPVDDLRTDGSPTVARDQTPVGGAPADQTPKGRTRDDRDRSGQAVGGGTADGGTPTDRLRDSTDGGWPDALVTAYRERWLPLTRLAYLLTGNRAVAEELVQDVFVRARPGWARIDRPHAYLHTAVVNATRDWGRRAEVAERHLPRTADHAVDHPDEMWDALARLDHRRRSAIVLRFYADLDDRSIAEVLGCRPATVRTLIHRGLRDLRREMTP